ncbi:MAG TPA: hypothetical protein VF481_03460 [Novosphingobium sp.]
MDLNDLYFRHQLSVMRAGSASDEQIRSLHLTRADELAQRIGIWQRRVGAGAASMWSACRAATHRDIARGAVS